MSETLSGTVNTFAKRIPNWLTCLRVLLIPVFVLLLCDNTPWRVWLATAVFIVAAITDYADGIVARMYGAVSDFGKLLDPLADKILVMAALVMLVALRDENYGDSYVPGWIVVMVLAREFWVTGLRAIAAKRGSVMSAASSGKVKSALQMVAIVFLLLHGLSFSVLGYRLPSQYIGLNLMLVSIFVSYWGAYEYTVAAFWPDGAAGSVRGLLKEALLGAPEDVKNEPTELKDEKKEQE